MKARPRDSDGNEIPGVNVKWWPVTPANVAILTPIANSYDAILEGTTDAGDTATVIAQVDGTWGGNVFSERSAPAHIRIGGLASFWISPSNVKLSVGDVQQLTVAGRDYCGNLFEFIPIE